VLLKKSLIEICTKQAIKSVTKYKINSEHALAFENKRVHKRKRSMQPSFALSYVVSSLILTF
jgi:hypothetical protein